MKDKSLVFSRLKRIALSNCGSATPEYAILTFLFATALMVSVGPFGYQIRNTFQSFGHVSGSDRQLVSNQPELTRVDSVIRSMTDSFSPAARWIDTLGTALLAVSFIWLLSRHKSKKEFKKPRPLMLDSGQSESQKMFDKRQQILQVISNNREDLLCGHLEVWHLADREPKTISPDQSVDSALAIMEKHQLEHLLVCEGDGILVGIVSKYFLLKTDLAKVADAMATQPLFVAPNAMLNPTVTHMLREGVSCVAVVQDGKAVGVLTTTDFQLTLQVTLQILAGTASEA